MLQSSCYLSLIYCSALNLLKAIEKEEQGRRVGHWNREEGKKVANLLGKMSLIKTSTFEGTVSKLTVIKNYLLPQFQENYITEFSMKSRMNLHVAEKEISTIFKNKNNNKNENITFDHQALGFLRVTLKTKILAFESNGQLRRQTACCRCWAVPALSHLTARPSQVLLLEV